MSRLWQVVHESYDKLITHALFIAFGVNALFVVPRSQSTTPTIFAIIFDVEFIVLGLILMVGTILGNYRLKLLGYLFYIIAMLTIGLLIIFVTYSPVSLLVLAFAVSGFSQIKEMKGRRDLLIEIQKMTRGPGVRDGDQ